MFDILSVFGRFMFIQSLLFEVHPDAQFLCQVRVLSDSVREADRRLSGVGCCRCHGVSPSLRL